MDQQKKQLVRAIYNFWLKCRQFCTGNLNLSLTLMSDWWKALSVIPDIHRHSLQKKRNFVLIEAAFDGEENMLHDKTKPSQTVKED